MSIKTEIFKNESGTTYHIVNRKKQCITAICQVNTEEDTEIIFRDTPYDLLLHEKLNLENTVVERDEYSIFFNTVMLNISRLTEL